MAVAVAAVSGVPDYVEANLDVKTRTLTFSSNYATGGEALAASAFGLKQIRQITFHGGVAAAADLATANPIFYNYATAKVVFFEGSAAGTALSEKTNAEAYPTGSFVRCTVRGV